MPTLRVAHIAAECSPLVKIGGLADVVGSLPQALHRRDVICDIIIPCYNTKQLSKLTSYSSRRLQLDFAGAPTSLTVHTGTIKGSTAVYWLLEHPLWRRDHPYSDNIESDIEIFSFFSYCAVEILDSIVPRPDVVHCHDWHTGLIPTLIDARYQRVSTWSTIPTVFTIHNLAHQGIGSHKVLRQINLSPDKELALMEDYYDDQILNILKVAILSADWVTTVSPTYAREIMRGSQDFGLAPFLKRRKNNFSGIMNGIDTDIFNPRTDAALFRRYSQLSWKQGKARNKKLLRKELGLTDNAMALGIIISRLTPQKGLDLIIPLLPRLTQSMQLIILGQGDTSIEQRLRMEAQQHKKSLVFLPELNLTLAQKLYAAADMLIMPSRFEPCGLGQMIAMRYGTVPVVRATGGLKDSVRNNQTGFAFSTYSSQGLWSALRRALAVYQSPKRWYTVVNNGLRQDFSWDSSARKYQQLYKKLL